MIYKINLLNCLFKFTYYPAPKLKAFFWAVLHSRWKMSKKYLNLINIVSFVNLIFQACEVFSKRQS